MSVRSIKRFTHEAMSSIFRNGLMTVASLFVVTACLFIFGIFLLFTMNVNFLGDQISDQCQLQVYITDEARDGGMIQQISNQIKATPGVGQVTFATGKETFDEFKEGMSEEELLAFEGVPDEAISDSFQLTLTDISLSQTVADTLSELDGVERVENQQKIIDMVNHITRAVRHVSLWAVLLFAFISVFIISNTIKLTVYSRRKEINIMKYVGATDSFIRWPFVIEGLIVGLIAAVLTFFIVESCYLAVLRGIAAAPAISAMFKLRTMGEVWLPLLVSFVVLGAIIGGIGSAVSIRKYLKV